MTAIYSGQKRLSLQVFLSLPLTSRQVQRPGELPSLRRFAEALLRKRKEEILDKRQKFAASKLISSTPPPSHFVLQ